MNPITDKIKQIISERNLNKTAFTKQLGMSRGGVYNLSDETIKLSTLISICDILNLQITDFFKQENSIQVVNEPSEKYGNKEFSGQKELEILRRSVVDKDKIIEFLERKTKGVQILESFEKQVSILEKYTKKH